VRQAAVVAISHSYNFHPWNAQGNLGIFLAFAARADERNLNMIVGRHRPGSFCLHGGQRMQPWSQ
jgi:hypothetical protein